MNKVGTSFFKDLSDEVFSVEFSSNKIEIDEVIKNKPLNFHYTSNVGKKYKWDILQTSHSSSSFESKIDESFYNNIQYVILREPNERLVSGINYLIIKYFTDLNIDENEILNKYTDTEFNELIMKKFLPELINANNWMDSINFLKNAHISPYISDLKTFIDDNMLSNVRYLDINSFSNFKKNNKYFLDFLPTSYVDDMYFKFQGVYHSKKEVKSKIWTHTMDSIIGKIIPNDFLNKDISVYNEYVYRKNDDNNI